MVLILGRSLFASTRLQAIQVPLASEVSSGKCGGDFMSLWL